MHRSEVPLALPNEMQISCKRPEENLRSLARQRSVAEDRSCTAFALVGCIGGYAVRRRDLYQSFAARASPPDSPSTSRWTCSRRARHPAASKGSAGRRNGPEHSVNFHWPEDLQSALQIEGALEMHCETFPPFLT
jgi:hypothetical protein